MLPIHSLNELITIKIASNGALWCLTCIDSQIHFLLSSSPCPPQPHYKAKQSLDVFYTDITGYKMLKGTSLQYFGAERFCIKFYISYLSSNENKCKVDQVYSKTVSHIEIQNVEVLRLNGGCSCTGNTRYREFFGSWPMIKYCTCDKRLMTKKPKLDLINSK